jgi:tRNA1(Val) A37 N6-methylase TrmN6
MEPCSAQVRGLRRCVDVVRSLGIVPGTAEIHEACAEDSLAKLPSKCSGLVFSSPPYFDWEKYSKQETQSFIRYRTYSTWVESFLRPVVHESHRILANGGYLAINTPNGDSRLSILEDVRQAARKSGFRLHRTYKLRLSKVPYLHPRNGKGKWEIIAVFKKVSPFR